MTRTVGGWPTLAVPALASALEAHSPASFRAWMGLYGPEQIAWLENENRIGSLCTDSLTIGACHAEHLAPSVAIYTVYAAPDTTARLAGELFVLASPGRGLSAQYRGAGGRSVVPFTPDLVLQDRGYGPYFQQTVIARRARGSGCRPGLAPAGRVLNSLDSVRLAPGAAASRLDGDPARRRAR